MVGILNIKYQRNYDSDKSVDDELYAPIENALFFTDLLGKSATHALAYMQDVLNLDNIST